MPIYHQGGNLYVVVVQHKGRRLDRRFRGSQKEALAYEVSLIEQIDAEDPALDLKSVPTFETFSRGAYALHAEAHLKSRTWSNRKYQIRTLIDHMGDLKLREICYSVGEKYQRDRLNDGIKPATINDDIKALKAILAYARRRGYDLAKLDLPDLPVRVKGVRKKKAWTLDEVRALFAAVLEKCPRLYPLVLFLANTGCRKGEALALEWSSVDFARRQISIEPNAEWQPKDGEPREVPMSQSLQSVLERPRLHKRWVFPHVQEQDRHKRHESGRYVYFPQREFDVARKAAGLAGGPHQLRHFYATAFLAKTPDVYLLSRILGHADVKLTMKVYAHLLPEHLERAQDSVDVGADVGAAEAESKSKWRQK